VEPEGERTERGYGRPPASQAGQASLEWTGLVLLVAALLAGLSVAVGGPASGLAHSVKRSILCAASLAGGCPDGPTLASVYGDEVAGEVERMAPELRLEEGVLGMPVDFRTCRGPGCAEGAGRMRTGSLAGEPATLFTRVVDCRDGGADADRPGCRGRAAGNLYFQYWAYFPESATFRGVPVLAERGYHRHDWESVQIRIDPSGEVSQRASSHAGHVHGRSVLNWPSDVGSRGAERLLERFGIRSRGGWGERTGRWFMAGGSHAGAASADPDRHPVTVRRSRIRLVPLEAIRSGPLARPARFEPITPPWRKRVWSDPEAAGTG
jgi:hypothetical protein